MPENFEFGSSREMDADGRMRVAKSNISKETVNPYYGYEIPGSKNLGLDAQKVYYLYRPGDELAKAAKTFCGVQIVDTHTPMYGDKPNKDIVIGATGTDTVFESPYLKSSLNFWDASAIDSIQSADKGLGGAKELSCGYSYEVVMQPGEFEGQRYDGKMTNIVGNHVALVDRGRAGHDVKVADAKPTEMKTKRDLQKECLSALDLGLDEAKLENIIDAMQSVEQPAIGETIMTNAEATEVKKAEDQTEMAKVEDESMKEKLKEKAKKKAEDEMEEEDAEDKKKKKAEDESVQKEMSKAMDKAMGELKAELQAQYRALDEAKRSVREIVGDSLSADSADEVYRFALDQLKISHSEIKETAALKAMCKLAMDKRVVKPATRVVMDAAPLAAKYPNLMKVSL